MYNTKAKRWFMLTLNIKIMQILKKIDLGTLITVCVIAIFVSLYAYGIASGQPATKDLSKQRSEKLSNTATIVTMGQSAYSIPNN